MEAAMAGAVKIASSDGVALGCDGCSTGWVVGVLARLLCQLALAKAPALAGKATEGLMSAGGAKARVAGPSAALDGGVFRSMAVRALGAGGSTIGGAAIRRSGAGDGA